MKVAYILDAPKQKKITHVAIVCVDASQHTKLPSLINFGHLEGVPK